MPTMMSGGPIEYQSLAVESVVKADLNIAAAHLPC